MPATKLTTLRDAANLFATRFATVKSWRLLELAIERLIAAAESAERNMVKIAARLDRTHGDGVAKPLTRRARTIQYVCGAGRLSVIHLLAVADK